MKTGARWTNEQYQEYLKNYASATLEEIRKDHQKKIGKQVDKSPEGRHNRIAWKKRKQELKEEGVDIDESFAVSFYLRKKNRAI